MKKYLVSFVFVLTMLLSSVSVFGATNSDVEYLKEAGFLKEDPANLSEPFTLKDWIDMMFNKDSFMTIPSVDNTVSLPTIDVFPSRYRIAGWGDAPVIDLSSYLILGTPTSIANWQFNKDSQFNKSVLMYNVYNYAQIKDKASLIRMGREYLLDEQLRQAYELKNKVNDEFCVDYKVGNAVIKVKDIKMESLSGEFMTRLQNRQAPTSYRMFKDFLDKGILKNGDTWGNTTGYVNKAEAYAIITKIFKAEGVSLDKPVVVYNDEDGI